MSSTTNIVDKVFRLGLCTLLLGAISLLTPGGNALALSIMGETTDFDVYRYKPLVPGGIPVKQGLKDPSLPGGDGVIGKDELVKFHIDVSGDPFYNNFLVDPSVQAGMLGNMVLQLTVIPGHGDADNDWVRLMGYDKVHSDGFNVLHNEVGNEHIIEIDLLNDIDQVVDGGTGTTNYSDSLILALLLNDNGEFWFEAADDTIISDAKLTLTTAIPEPGSMLLLGSGLVGLAAWRMRKP